LGKVDPCSGTVDYSPTICSADLEVTAQNNVNNLTWATSITDVVNFTIIRNGTTLTSVTATTFSDVPVICGTEYSYQIVTNYMGATSISATRTVTAISNNIPNSINEISSVVDGGSVTLTWQPDAIFEAESYLVFRQTGGRTPNLLESGITATQYIDENYSSDNNYCYQVRYEDNCGNTSIAGVSACPIVLTYTTNSDDDIILSWTIYEGWASGVQRYELYKYDLQHNLLGAPRDMNLLLTFKDDDLTDQGYYYVVRAIPIDADNEQSVSNEVAAIRSLRFAYPKAFTPDNEGPPENETFKVFVVEEFIDRFEMKIFNRWGEMIFSTSDLLKGWDGKFNGEPQPEGTYTFIATLKDKTGRTYKRDGAVMLLRKK
jgi:gliding motility-associated-like protein